MSIGFTFKAKTRKIDALKESVKEMAEESGYGLALNENWLTVSFCTMGDLSMEWERESGLRGQWLITGNCCSTPAGAGFHAAAVRFLDELGQKRLSELLVDDETEYYNHRDFERMKREHFYPWLNALKRHCAERGSGYSNFCLCWGYGAVSARGSPRHGYNPDGTIQYRKYDKADREKWHFLAGGTFFYLGQ